MPARHKSLQDDLLLEADFNRTALVDERGCRRDIRSNGWIVSFEEFASRKPFRQKKQVFFVRCGSQGPQFHRAARPSVKSGPDVFADALVPQQPAREDARRCRFPKLPSDCSGRPRRAMRPGRGGRCHASGPSKVAQPANRFRKKRSQGRGNNPPLAKASPISASRAEKTMPATAVAVAAKQEMSADSMPKSNPKQFHVCARKRAGSPRPPVAFRFVFIYFILYCLPSPLQLFLRKAGFVVRGILGQGREMGECAHYSGHHAHRSPGPRQRRHDRRLHSGAVLPGAGDGSRYHMDSAGSASP